MPSNLLKIGTKTICVWRNYAAHAKDLGNAVPKEPVLFVKPASSYLDRPRDPAPHHGELKNYIVFMCDEPESDSLAIQSYKTIISNILGKNATDALLCIYPKRSFNGFAVRMNEEQKNLMSKVKGILSIFEAKNNELKLHTTRSRHFMTRSPTKASGMFSGTVDKCATCGKTAYPLEKVTFESQAYDKTRFKCSHGGCALSPSNFAALEADSTKKADPKAQARWN